MLTVDLVQAYRRGDRLVIRPLKGDLVRRAAELAEAYIAIAANLIGEPQESFSAACKGVTVHANEKKLAGGLLKMVRDRCTFEPALDVDPQALRQAVFREASRIRGAAEVTEDFDREEIFTRTAESFGLSAEDAERALFSDLKSAHCLQAFDAVSPETLVAKFERAQEQAVLLKATRVVAEVKPASAALMRSFFHRLKFLRLLYKVAPLDRGGYRVELDGPFSLFSSVTKYGLQLAQVLPALDECGTWRLTAEVIWGKEKRRMLFSLKNSDDSFSRIDDTQAPILSDDVQSLILRFDALESEWTVQPASDILEAPGKEVCIPDVVFTHRETGEVVYLEVMGFWSREAVWRRVDLVKAGLDAHIIFAVSKRLRVSEAVLDGDFPGVLYVYKGVMNATKILHILNEKNLRSKLDTGG